MQKSVAVGVSLTKEILSKTDIERGDVSRSRYIQRLIEKDVCDNNKGGVNTQ
jgi:metal-responsive CopG/Arc/MetJ family transcriptional regulator